MTSIILSVYHGSTAIACKKASIMAALWWESHRSLGLRCDSTIVFYQLICKILKKEWKKSPSFTYGSSMLNCNNITGDIHNCNTSTLQQHYKKLNQMPELDY